MIISLIIFYLTQSSFMEQLGQRVQKEAEHIRLSDEERRSLRARIEKSLAQEELCGPAASGKSSSLSSRMSLEFAYLRTRFAGRALAVGVTVLGRLEREVHSLRGIFEAM